jgi:hypothetical protein
MPLLGVTIPRERVQRNPCKGASLPIVVLITRGEGGKICSHHTLQGFGSAMLILQ